MNGQLTTITAKFQVHIPSGIRKAIGLKRHGRAKISVKDKKIVIEPLKNDFLSLAGSYKVKKAIPAEKIRENLNYTF